MSQWKPLYNYHNHILTKIFFLKKEEASFSQVLVAHTYNPNYLESWNQEDSSSRPAWANNLQDLSSTQKKKKKKNYKKFLLRVIKGTKIRKRFTADLIRKMQVNFSLVLRWGGSWCVVLVILVVQRHHGPASLDGDLGKDEQSRLSLSCIRDLWCSGFHPFLPFLLLPCGFSL
jgi:hypothetical protein